MSNEWTAFDDLDELAGENGLEVERRGHSATITCAYCCRLWQLPDRDAEAEVKEVYAKIREHLTTVAYHVEDFVDPKETT